MRSLPPADSGLKYALVRLSFYTENLWSFFPPRRGADGTLGLAMPVPLGDAQLSVFSVGDLGHAVVTILSNADAHNTKAYGLASEWLTGAEVTALLSKVIGEPVTYQPVPVEVFKTFPFPGAADIGNMFAFYQRRELFTRSVDDTRALIPSGVTSAEAALTANAAVLRGIVKQ